MTQTIDRKIEINGETLQADALDRMQAHGTWSFVTYQREDLKWSAKLFGPKSRFAFLGTLHPTDEQAAEHARLWIDNECGEQFASVRATYGRRTR